MLESHGDFLVKYGDQFFNILWSPLAIVVSLLLVLTLAIFEAIF